MAEKVTLGKLARGNDTTSRNIGGKNDKQEILHDEQQQQQQLKQRSREKMAPRGQQPGLLRLMNQPAGKIAKQNLNRNGGAKQTTKSQRQRAKKPRGAAALAARMNSIASSLSSLSTGQHTQKSDGSDHICSGCQRPIKDRYLLSACDKFWHDQCLRCDRCHAKLGELGSILYERANMTLCRQDYLEMFGQRATCAVCDKFIYASEMVMRARDNVYHLECFACQLCGLRFCIGDRFHLCENKIVCQYDYDEHIYPIQESMLEPTAASNTHQMQPEAAARLVHHGHNQLDSGSMSMLATNHPSPPEQQQTISSGEPGCRYTSSPLLAFECDPTGARTKETRETRLASDQQQGRQLDACEEIELTVLGGCGTKLPLATCKAPDARCETREDDADPECADGGKGLLDSI